MPFTQDQAIALLSLLSEGKLISELTELLTLDTDNNFVAINSGSNDAKKIKIPLLRGYKGTYNASTNTPSLSNTVGLEGDMYVVSVAGSRDFGAGTVELFVDDIIIYLNGKYLKTNGIVTGSLDFQGVYDNSSPKTITVADSTDGTLTVKDSATNNNRDEILQVKDTSGNILFYVQRDKVYIKDNVGIGTENPTEKLEVDGIVKATKFYANDFASGAPVVGVKGKGTGQSYVMYISSTDDTKTLMDFLEVTGHCTVIRLNNDGVRKVQISSSGNSYFNIGNLGIGTDNPAEKLEVDGNIKLTGLINGILKLGDTTTPTLDFGSSNTTTGWGSTNLGYNNTVSASFGFAAGSEHSVTNYAGAALGYENTIDGTYGFAAVRNNNVRVNYSAALGVALLSDSYGCLVVGLSNKDITGESWYSTSLNDAQMPVFVVGNGDIDGDGNSTSRSDALMVLKNGNVGIGVHPSEKLEVKGRIYINPNASLIDGNPASELLFQSVNDLDVNNPTAKASIYCNNYDQNSSGIVFATQQGSTTLNSRLEIRKLDGDVEVKQNLLVGEVIKLSGTLRTYADLPSTPTQGMISYITDASSVSYRGTAAGGGSDAAIVFYDGSNWIYH